VGGERGRAGGDGEEAREAADRAGQGHRADVGVVDADARVARGVLGVADDGDLIAVLGVAQIDVHEGRQNEDDQHGPAVVLVVALGEQVADPADVLDGAAVVDGADGVGSRRVLPHGHTERGELDGDVVHHQGKQCLVRVPLGLEEAGHDAPDAARHDGGDDHADEQQNGGHLAREFDHPEGGGDAADQHLALGADVPEPHFERGREADGNAGEDHAVADGDPDALAGAERAVGHGAVDLQRVQLHNRIDHDGVDDERQQNGDQADAPGLALGYTVALGNMHISSPLRAWSS